MLRHFACGYRDFRELPDVACARYNWIILASFDGKLSPRLDPPSKGEKKRAKANFYVIPPQIRYVLIPETPRCFRAVFHFSYVGEILHDEVLKRGILSRWLDEKTLAEVKDIASTIKSHFRNPTIISELHYELALLRLSLIALDGLGFEKTNPLQSVPRERVEKALAWYNEHIKESPSLYEVAQNVHISATQLRRHFYEQIGRSPKAAFSRERMHKATRLLTNTSSTLDQIAEECGFQSSTDFCRAFKKTFNVTPNHWRHNVNASGQVDVAALSVEGESPSV